MAALNGYETQDDYTENGTLLFIPSQLVSVTVTNNPILAQFQVATVRQMKPGSFPWSDERRMLLMLYNWTPDDFQGFPIVGIRVRSAVPGSSAIVDINA